jgi:hypothetical protein
MLIFILEILCLLLAWFIVIGILTLILDGPDAFRKNKQ